jgi:transposase InsO family protein
MQCQKWRCDYNQARPHSALGYRMPEEFGALQGRPSPASAIEKPLACLIHQS